MTDEENIDELEHFDELKDKFGNGYLAICTLTEAVCKFTGESYEEFCDNEDEAHQCFRKVQREIFVRFDKLAQKY